MKKILLSVVFSLATLSAFAGNDKFTPDVFHTPSGKQTKVLINYNPNGMALVVACKNKVIGGNPEGKVLLVGQDWDVVTQVTQLGNGYIRVETPNGWREVFKAKSIPKC